MIARLAWGGLFALLAVVTVLAQLDRASRFEPGLAPLVPEAFRGFATRHLAAAALLARDAEGAEAQARALVRARPLPAEHLTLLAQSATLAGDETQALAALEEATTRGWRDPLAQQAAAEAALQAGEAGAAAQRIAALLATGALPDQTGAQLARLLAEPAGRRAFAALLAGPGRWQRNFPAFAAPVTAPADLAETLALAQAAGAGLPCARLEGIAESYLSAGMEAQAARFWPGPCADR